MTTNSIYAPHASDVHPTSTKKNIMTGPLRGVIAAIATPLTPTNQPDGARFVDHARDLLATGCDGLNVLGTTGEATSFSLQARLALMDVAAKALPCEKLMVGTGTPALDDTVLLTRAAWDLGFSGALVLPPFYYKDVSEDGLHAYIGALVAATADAPIPLYLYNFPALSGLAYGPALVARLFEAFPPRIRGLKDSSGDMDYAHAVAAIDPALSVFPSNEATLLAAHDGPFAGCISATANLNAPLCAKAYRQGDRESLDKAVAVRALFTGRPLIAGVKATIAHLRHDPQWASVCPPLSPSTSTQGETYAKKVSMLRA
ncbi:dihydrodipicolinate synthase family protein [Varunaivibrio sulfuroxidans]|uniref:dihydrodipicolinate synthase family protein n=1 Tax=Varunaivibrio sulfuroxidans TaxID=1773489 RepID=UPI0023E30D6C|nr:dihydrodipicolinate synthase family protein [Varunaivibrio sulfuroxidans]WES30160.1 dihydrodipicolinate synthase family protein [Varunaivibrio sulfuroxidans]